ncbi:MAG: 50S ribosomal protein L11 methyltransferase [Thermoanaerobaculia bacterium]
MYSINSYGDMIGDRVRRETYLAALEKTVRPGDLVLELGTGPGFFAFAACKLGARVVAVEPEPIIQIAREIAAANGLSDRIQFIEDRSDRITLPEKADVLLSDLRGVLPLHGAHLPAIVDARTRLLKRGGVQIPETDAIWGAVVEASDTYRRSIEAWVENGSGLDMSAAWRLTVNTIQRFHFKPEHLATEPVLWATLDYTSLREPDVAGTLRFTAQRDATVHGVALWFDSTLTDGISLSNAPSREPLVYGNFYLPFQRAVELRAADAITVAISARLVNDDYVWRWDTNVERDGNSCWRAKQSSFYGAPLSLANLRTRSQSQEA